MKARDNNVVQQIVKLRELRQSHYAAIGRIAVEFSEVEFYLSHYIAWLLSSYSNIGKLITLDLGFARLLTMFGRLFHYQEKDRIVRTQLKPILEKLKELYAIRNQFVHDLWDIDYLDHKFVRRKELYNKKDQAIDFKPYSYELDDIKKIGDDVSTAVHEFTSFMQDWMRKYQPKREYNDKILLQRLSGVNKTHVKQ
jgi:hypothetical protein